MQLSLWCLLVSFDQPAGPSKQKSIFVKYFDFLDNLITCTKEYEENNQITFYQPTPTTLQPHPLNILPSMQLVPPSIYPFFVRDGQYAVQTHYLTGTVNIWWKHTSLDQDGKYVVGMGTHIIQWGQTKCLGTHNYMWDRHFFLGYMHEHTK